MNQFLRFTLLAAALSFFEVSALAHVVLDGPHISAGRRYLYFKSGNTLERHVCPADLIVVSPSNCRIEMFDRVDAKRVYDVVLKRVGEPIEKAGYVDLEDGRFSSQEKHYSMYVLCVNEAN